MFCIVTSELQVCQSSAVAFVFHENAYARFSSTLLTGATLRNCEYLVKTFNLGVHLLVSCRAFLGARRAVTDGSVNGTANRWQRVTHMTTYDWGAPNGCLAE